MNRQKKPNFARAQEGPAAPAQGGARPSRLNWWLLVAASVALAVWIVALIVLAVAT